MSSAEHPFAPYVRIIGKGKHTHRSFTYQEAREAMSLILQGEVEDIQLGAFLLLLRVKGEEVQEMAGFARATRDFVAAPRIAVDIDWPSYAGKHKQQNWYLLAAALLASQGHRIFMHGTAYPTTDRLHSETVLRQLQIPACSSWPEVEQQLQLRHFAYSPLHHICAPLDRLFSLRPLLGVRSPVHSFIKLVNPLAAPLGLQSVFHPAYLELQQEAAHLLDQPKALVMKGEGGELEFRPDADNRLFLVRGSTNETVTWSRCLRKRSEALELEQLSPQQLLAVWRGEQHDEYGLSAILGTVAMVLFTGGHAATEQQAWQMARDYWEGRPRHHPFPALT